MKNFGTLLGGLALWFVCATSALAQSYTVTGSIQDASGNGLGGLIAIRTTTGDFVSDIWVNGDGSPTTSGPIPAGQYVAYAAQAFGFVEELWTGGEPNLPCPNLSCDLSTGTLIDLTAADVTGIDFVLDPIVGGGRLQGNVVYPDGTTPVVGLSMGAFNANGEYLAGTATDRFGNFDLGPLSDGDVYLRTENDAPDGLAPEVWNGGEPGNTVCVPFDLCFDVAGNGAPITIAGSDVGGLDFQLEVPAGGQVIGSFEDLDFGFPLADLNVELLDVSGNFIAAVPTDATGTYTFAGLADGDYKVFINGPTEGYPQYLIGDGSCSVGCDTAGSGTLFTVTGGATANVGSTQVPYEGGPRITGIITRNDTGQPVSSRVAFMSADIHDASGNFLGGFGTDRGGRYQAQLPAGDYVVITGGDQSFHQLVQERFDNISCAFGCDPTDPSPGTVTIPATVTQTAIADFGLDPARSISGTVTSTADGLGIENLTVCVEPEPEPDGQLIACTNTDANGDYLIGGLDARNDYVATTFNNGLLFLDEVYDDLRDVPLSAGLLIDVTSGDATGINFALDPAGFLSGAIQDESGNPLNDGGGVQIFVADASGNVVWEGNNGDSTWTSATFPAGDYYAYAQGEGFGRTSEVWNNVDCPNLTCDITTVGTPITITGGEVTDIDFTLAPAEEFTITGSIQDASGNGIGGRISLRRPNGEFVADVWVNGDGSQTTSFPIAAGQYVAFAAEAPGFEFELWTGGEPNLACPNLSCDFGLAQLIDLTSGDVSGIDFVLDPIVGGGRLSGNVVEAADGVTPVEFVSIAVLNANGEFITGGVTDLAGNFTTQLLSDGDVYLRLENDAPRGLAPEVWNGGEPNNTVCVPFDLCFDPVGNGTPITIAGSDVGALDFQLEVPAGGQVIGSFEDLDFGFPLADLNVELLDSNGNYVNNVRSDRTGGYTFSGLADGAYKVFISGPSEGYPQFLVGVGSCSGGCDRANTGALFTVSGGSVENVGSNQVPYEGDPRITGLVTRSDTGDGVSSRSAFVDVAAFDPSGNFVGSSATDTAGRYQILPPGGAGDYALITNHDVQFFGLINELFENVQCPAGCDPNDPARTLVTAPDTGDRTAVADFALDPGRSISGTVTATADGSPIGGITVCAEPEPVPDFSQGQCETTDVNGDYRIEGLIAGSDYVVWTFNNGQPFIDEVYDDRKNFDFSLGDPVDVSAADASGIDFALDAGGFLSGAIQDEAGNPLNDGGAVEIVVLDAAGNEVWRGNNGDSTWTSATFVAGDYYAYAFGENFGVTSEVWNDQPCPSLTCDILTLGTPITITGGEITGIDFTLAPAQEFTITGSIQDAAGNGIGGAISLRKSNGDFVADIWVNGDGSPTTSFPIPAGQYVVFANQAFGFVEELWNGGEPNLPCPNLGCDYNSGVLVDLTAGDATGIDFVLDPIVGGGRLSGTVTDPLGNPVVGVSVVVMNGRGDNVQYLATDRFGNFNTGPLSNGDVYLRTEPDAPDGLAPELWNGGEPANTVCVPFDLCFDTLGFGTPITIAGSDVGALDFQLEVPAGGQLTGRVVDADLTFPLADQFIQVFDSFGGFVAGTQTDGTGTYTFAGLPDGDYKLLVNGPSEGYESTLFGFGACNGCDIGANGTVFTVSGGGVTTNLDQPLQYVGGPRITGFVTRTDTGEPVSSRLGYAGADFFDTSGNGLGGGPTDRSGRYQIVTGSAGDYVVISTHDQGFHGLINEIYNDVACGNNCDPNDPARTVLSVPDTGTRTAIADFALDPGASISGTITATDGGAPIELMGVCAEREPEPDYQTSVCVETDASGNYTINGLLPASDYVVYSNNFNGLPFVEEVYNDRKNFDFTQADLIDVTAGDATGIDFALDAAPEVSGTVFVDDGTTVSAANGEIRVLVLTPTLDFVAGTDIAAAGTWSVNIPAGDYLIAAAPYTPGTYQQYVAEFTDGTRIGYNSEFNLFSLGINTLTIAPFTVGGPTAGVDITLEQGVTIEGTLRDENTGAPLTGGVVTTNTPSFDRELSYGFVRPDGTYTVAAFPAEEYLLFHSGFSVGYGREIGGVNKCLRDGPGGCDSAVAASTPQVPAVGDQLTQDLDVVRRIAISGRVVDDVGNPIQGLRVRLRVAADDFIAAEVWTDSNGDWFTDNVAPGSYYVTAAGEDSGFSSHVFNQSGSNECPQEFCDFAALGTLVENFDGQDKGGIDFMLSPAQFFTITGSIQDASGNGIGGQIAILDPINGNQVAEIFVNFDGSPTTSFPIPAGQYVVYAGRRFGVEGFVEELWNGGEPLNLPCPLLGCDLFGGTMVDLTAGDVSGIDFVLDPVAGGGRLSGAVIDPLSNPVVGVSLVVVNAAGINVQDLTTDRFGNFSSPLLADGQVYLRVENDAPGGLAPELWNGGEPNNTVCVPFDPCFDPVANGAPITIAGSDVGGLDFQLEVPAGGQVIGSFEDLDFGFPLADLNVELLDVSGNFVAAVPTDATGTYTFTGLADGDYKVFINGPTEGYPQYLIGDGSCSVGCDPVNSGVLFNVTSGGTANVGPTQVPYEGGPRITGIVSRDDTGEPVSSRVRFVGVNVYDSAGNFQGGYGTDRSGRFQAQLTPGDYVALTFNDHGLLDEIWDNVPCEFGCGPNDPNASPITIPGTGTLTGLADFGLDVGRTVSGTVRAEDNLLPIAGANVCIGIASEPTNGFRRCELSDASGRFSFAGLAAKPDYAVGVDDFSGQAFFPELFQDAPCCDLSQATPIDTTAGDQDITIDVARSASIAGTIRRSSNLDPIANVFVDIFDASCAYYGSGQSDASGNYSVGGFGAGTYFVFAASNSAGFVPELYPNLRRLNPCNPDSITDGTAITVTSTQNVAGIDFELDRGASISGFISDANGVLPPFWGQARLYATDGTQLFVGSNGEPDSSYVLRGLPAGDYNVILSGAGGTQGLVDEIFNDIQCPRNSCPQGTGVTISLAPGEARTGISAVLDAGSQISGRLTDAVGNPLAGVCIAVYNDLGVYAGFACSDANGDYTTRNGFPSGDYLVSNQFNINGPQPVGGNFIPIVYPSRACGEPCNFLLGDPVSVDGVNPATGIDLVFQSGSAISGVVTGNGGAAGGVQIRLLDATDGSLVRSTSSSPDGSYSFNGLAAGDYRLRTFNSIGLNDQLYLGVSCNPFCDPLSGTIVNLPPDTQQTGLDFSLVSTPRIVGTVLNDIGSAVGGVRVEAYNSLGALVASTTSEPDGSFEIGNLFSGTFFVRTKNTLGFVDALADGLFCPPGCNPVLDGTAIGVGSSGTFPSGGLNLQLGDASSLFGQVTSGATALAAIDVEVYTPAGALAATTVTADDGRYRIDGLAAGDYHVVTRNGQGFIDEGASGAACPSSCAPTTTTPIAIGISQDFELNFSLNVGGRIAGRVTDSLGASLPSVEVTVFTDAGAEVASAITDASGSYAVNALLPADYVARTTSNPHGLRNRLYDDQACDTDCNVLGGTLISLTSGTQVSGIDFVLPDGKSISGAITDSGGTGLGGIRVAAFDSAGAEAASAVTGPGGLFTISGLADDVFRLRTFNSQGYVDQAIGGIECTPRLCDLALSTPFDVTASSQTGADASLGLGQSLTGVATDETGNPIFSGTAQLYSDEAELLKTAPISDGSFFINGLAAGTYYAVVTNDLGLVDQAWTGPGNPGLDCPGGSCLSCLTSATCAAPPAGPAPIVLAAPARNGTPTNPRGATGSNLSFQLPSGERLQGSVTDAQGDPIPGIRVYFFNDAGADAGSALSDGLGGFRSDAAFGAGNWVAATRKPGRSGAIGFIDELFDDIPCGSVCDPQAGNIFSTPSAPLIEFQLDRVPTERIFGSGFE